MSRWKWISGRGGVETFRSVGINPDGSLWNPNGYPEDDVRAAVAAAEAKQHERRSKAAKEAAETRRIRQAQQTVKLAKLFLAGKEIFGPKTHCAICGKAVNDEQSIARGVGSDCWQKLLQAVQELQKRDAAAHDPRPTTETMEQ